MYLLKANVPRSLVQELTDALIRLGVMRIRLAEVSGYTDGIEQERLYRGRTLMVQLVQEVELEALVPNESLEQAVDTAMVTIRRERSGDGYISVAPLEQCYRVSTGNPGVRTPQTNESARPPGEADSRPRLVSRGRPSLFLASLSVSQRTP